MMPSGGTVPRAPFPDPVPLPAGTRLVRIHPASSEPIWFGPRPGVGPRYRFDAPKGEYRILYAAQRLEGAFAETILRNAKLLVPRDQVSSRCWSVLETTRELLVAKLYDNGLIAHGQTADICAGDDYVGSQGFALNLHSHRSDLAGIVYRARHDNGELCLALFDRVMVSDLRIVSCSSFRQEAATTEGLMARYGASWETVDPLPSLSKLTPRGKH